jgi:dipeptidyl aminopeptidase/acylaminoacyl peptidase
MTLRKLSLLLLLLCCTSLLAADKPKLTLDEFFNFVDFPSVKLSPDGQSVVICAERADWDQNIFRKDLWLYRNQALTQLTRSGHDSDPQWSPDGRWIAFFSDRKALEADDAKGGDDSKEDTYQIYVISPFGGESIPVTTGEEEVHAFAWASDSKSLYFATRQPWTKDQKEAYKKEWKDVVRYRDAERGDTIFRIAISDAMARAQSLGTKPSEDSNDAPDATPGAKALAVTPWHVSEIAVSLNGQRLAFVTTSVSERQERVEEFELYEVELASATPEKAPKQLTRNEGVEQTPQWASDNQHVYFEVAQGSHEGKYKDTQKRLYWVDADSGQVQRWAADFNGEVETYSIAGSGVVASARTGTEVQIYSAPTREKFARQIGWAGTYDRIETSTGSPRVALIYSALQKPTEIYLAESIEKLQDARPITSFNKLFTERDLPQGKPYQWKSDDGTTIEGMLMYPPGKFEAKNLPMFVLIHGGPADADGNHFEADWYQWDRLAAGEGWLVFEPNYRGSSGYGDQFLAQIVPEIVSRPGKDILTGVDQLVKDGIADPARLAIGGYSYGGYMTNWLITQTTRFKAAVTGAGAVEHIANWGNDDMTFDDAYFLGGVPWEAPQRYHDEAAIFQINKVKTPTHIVGGENDIRVAVAENYLLDHALHNLRIPSTLLIFPGEGHSLSKNPWHGKIKVREEMKWLQMYGGVGEQ